MTHSQLLALLTAILMTRDIRATPASAILEAIDIVDTIQNLGAEFRVRPGKNIDVGREMPKPL